jgi:gluconate 2-dehydrogenase alpha chain
MQTREKTDVVIVGLGAGGGMAAYVLANAGLKVVGLEAGPRLDNADFMADLDEISGWWIRNKFGDVKFNRETPTWRPNPDAPTQAPPVPASPMMNGVGGSSIHYTSMSWRLTENDFKIRSSTIDRYGESAIPEGSTLADWPVDSSVMEPYYDNVEYIIGVSGEGGANPHEAPRARNYPMPPIHRSGYVRLGEEAAAGLGYNPFPLPSAINSEPYNDRPACTYCGYCTGFGCWNDSKSSTLVTSIRAAEETGNLDVRPNSRVTRILSNDEGQVTGVEYVDDSGEIIQQPAGVVMIGTYVYENVRLLLLSSSDYFPNGLANNSGQVGRNYMVHLYPGVSGLFPGKEMNTWSGSGAQGTAIDDLNGDNFDHTGLGFIRGSIVTIRHIESAPIGASRRIPPSVRGWGSDYKRWLNENGNSVAFATGQLEVLPHENNFLDLDPEATDQYGQPVIRITFDYGENERLAFAYVTEKLHELVREMGATETWEDPLVNIPINTHAYGGTRMGDDPETSVVNRYSLAHEAPNLAILGGSTFPSTSGYNPTQTIQALAWMSAEYIAENFSDIAV